MFLKTVRKVVTFSLSLRLRMLVSFFSICIFSNDHFWMRSIPWAVRDLINIYETNTRNIQTHKNPKARSVIPCEVRTQYKVVRQPLTPLRHLYS